MTRPIIEADRFAETIDEMLRKVKTGTNKVTPIAIQLGIRKGATAWRRNIRQNFKTGKTYRKHGKTYEVGAYSKSIRSHMLSNSGSHPSGEIGAPKMPGLPHLLENGHARVGGGRVRAIPHVSPAADVAFKETIEALEDGIGGMLDDI